jgi:holo-[acyl-carrier protein] synthase
VILGVGLDICRVERIRRSLKEFGYDWADEAFTVGERKFCEQGPDPALLFAQGLCGKEACFKALGTGRSADIDWRDIEVLQSGPSVALNLLGGALDELQRITPAGHDPTLHITCSGNESVAQAIVIISAVNKR